MDVDCLRAWFAKGAPGRFEGWGSCSAQSASWTNRGSTAHTRSEVAEAGSRETPT